MLGLELLIPVLLFIMIATTYICISIREKLDKLADKIEKNK